MFYDILESTNAFLGYKKKKFKKSKNWQFFKGVHPWLWSKNGHYGNFFSRQYRSGKCLSPYSRTKNSLCRLKKNKFENTMNWHFTKRDNPCSWSNNGHLGNLFFSGNIGQKIVFYDILERKYAFLGYKNKKFKKLKNWHFSKGVNPWFWSKNGHFSNFFFLGNIGQENVFYDTLERKNAFLGY